MKHFNKKLQEAKKAQKIKDEKVKEELLSKKVKEVLFGRVNAKKLAIIY